ncbi:hypothetical protein KIPB_013669 [Kipferlia bialata]|uniref:Uncharacterized protein n=1 Tax=Kipferlia bialata TaxID=797122 RepID=A0A9K3D9U1_9EUKA|nr:hypothetical protein KIPB_013669 [Kipferlia bialata]|eukprot:g13669.t1
MNPDDVKAARELRTTHVFECNFGDGEKQSKGASKYLVKAGVSTGIIPFSSAISEIPGMTEGPDPGAGAMTLRKSRLEVEPKWHPRYKLNKVVTSHQGWVNCIAVDPTNEMFFTGSNDATIKVGIYG